MNSASQDCDPVGNRLSRTTLGSGLGTLGSTAATFDADDRLNSDTYDANGNTLLGSGFGQSLPDEYDFENRLVTRHTSSATVRITYDGDGNRVSKTLTTSTNSVTTYYVVDELNPSGYAQVLEERVSLNSQPSALNCVYTYGHALISQDRFNGASWVSSFYGYDGHNNIRYLTDVSGNVTDTYDYDAFGNLTARTSIGTPTPNSYLFTGEQYDADLGLYYLRARYQNTDTGRFWTQDSFEGFSSDPTSLHKYTYCGNNPINAFDPSGNVEATVAGESAEMSIGSIVQATVSQIFKQVMGSVYGRIAVGGWLGYFDAKLNGQDPATGALIGALSFAGFGAVPQAFWATSVGRAIIFEFLALGAEGVEQSIREHHYWGAGLRSIFLIWGAFGVFGENPASSPEEDNVVNQQEQQQQTGPTGQPSNSVIPRPVDGTTMTIDDALDAAEAYLGEGYRQLDDGVFVSKDGTRLVRLTDADILGKHAGGPHMNFEEGKTISTPNLNKPGGVKESFETKRNGNSHVFLK